MYGIFEKPSKRAFQTCTGLRAYVPPKKTYQRPDVGRSGIFSWFSTGFLNRLCHCSAPNLPKTLEMGPTKARNIFSTLKLGGWHVATPRDPLFVTRKPSCGVLREARSFVHMGSGGEREAWSILFSVLRARSTQRGSGSSCWAVCSRLSRWASNRA